MKVVFMEEVEGTARVGEIKNVADGFARNYLLPRRLAAPATEHYISIAESRAEKEARRQVRLDEEATTYVLPKMEGASVAIEVRVGEQGKLFGSVTARDISAALQETTGVELEHRQVDLRHPIRELGSHEVTVKLTRNVGVQVVVNVEPLGGMPEEEAEAAEAGEEPAEGEAAVEEPVAAEAEAEEETAEAEAAAEEAPVEEEPAAAEIEEEPAEAEAAVEEAPAEEEPAPAEAEAEVEEEPAEAEAAVEEAPVEEEPAAAEAEVEEEPTEAGAVEEAPAEEEPAPAEEEREAEGAEDEPSEGEISEDDKGET